MRQFQEQTEHSPTQILKLREGWQVVFDKRQQNMSQHPKISHPSLPSQNSHTKPNVHQENSAHVQPHHVTHAQKNL